jgi:hypothetical protein
MGTVHYHWYRTDIWMPEGRMVVYSLRIRSNWAMLVAERHLLYTHTQEFFPDPPCTVFRMFSRQWKAHKSCPDSSKTSLMLSVNPLAWLEIKVHYATT